ncbi:NLI interacting factor-like phosphatase [Entamoeba marina]
MSYQKVKPTSPTLKDSIFDNSRSPFESDWEDDDISLSSDVDVDVDFDVVPFDPFSIVKKLPPPTKLPTGFKHLLPKSDSKQMTVIIELEDILIHSKIVNVVESHSDFSFVLQRPSGSLQVETFLRPHTKNFLQSISETFEIVLFTTCDKDYVQKILEHIDPKQNIFKHVLYKNSCIKVGSLFIKDLRRLGRDLKRIVIIDKTPTSFGYHLENGILITTWSQQQNDKELEEILPLLYALNEEQDVRVRLKSMFQLYRNVE